MKVKPKELNLVQGSKEWLEARKGKITGSLVASCIGQKGAFLSKEKVASLIKGQSEVFVNKAMKEGAKKEPEIREKAQKLFECDIRPAVFCDENMPLFLASLDGISEDKKTIFEFKYSDLEAEQIEDFAKPSDKYLAQVQFGMHLSGATSCIFVAMDKKGELHSCKVLKDEAFIETMLDKIALFIDEYLFNEAEKKELKDKELIKKATKLKELLAKQKELENEIKALKEALITGAKGENAECEGVKILKNTRSTTDYKAFLKSKKLEVPSEFIKESVSWQVRV